MRPSLILVPATLALAAQASWFSSSEETPYKSWNTKELRAWLEVHNVHVPEHPTHNELVSLVQDNWDTASAWTQDQYYAAQKSFADLRDTAFETWDESRLRQWLLEHGVVAPKGPKEHLVLLAKQKYKAYDKAASSYASQASATISTAIYGDTKHQMSKSATSVASQATSAAAQATKEVARAFDESKDYVYSTWDDNQMRSWLEEKGVIKPKAQVRREELLEKMHSAWGRVANPIWEAWSSSYIHDWLVSHNIIKSDFQKNREALEKQMKKYYYSTSDTVYGTWTDSQMRQWLIDHGVMKSDAQASRDKMMKLMRDNYLSAKDTFWDAWSDNSIRDWLIEHGYMRSDAQVKRDELIKLANEKWNDQVARTSDYLVWPDARLRAYLRNHGVDDSNIPEPRPILLQEVRVRWVQSKTKAENVYDTVKEMVNSGIYKAEDALHHVFALLSGGWEDAKEKAESTKRSGEQGWEDAKTRASGEYEKASNWASETAEDARQKTGEKVKIAGQKIKGEL
ncbi:hypothetical protein CVT26_011969 [Gymnopilus dilepis]|uniref:Uncharacterized protein n=1 Tax=Gymnopilus dilepis TaxID=231916 RepID=A0A409VYH8_9AGAR|nr:hypothetical protein CVT26_011969 [Gymnopilus dilepis]